MAANAIGSYTEGLPDGEEFKQAAYARDRAC
jgi:hypothetical protein